MDCRRWDVVEVDFGNPIGHEQGKQRPAVVVSNDSFNQVAHLVAVVAITSRQPARYPSEVDLPDLPGVVTAGVVMTQQIRTLSTDRVVRIRGPLKDPVLQRRIEQAIARFLDLPRGRP